MSKYDVKDSGERREFDTGARRDMGGGKGRFDLLPYWSLMELAKHYEAGAEKYDDNNWRKGIPLKVFFDSAMRHLAKLAMGYTDERHDLAALWNIACYIETAQRIKWGFLPQSLKDFPHVRMSPTDALGPPIEAHDEELPSNPCEDFRPMAWADWVSPAPQEQLEYIEGLNRLHLDETTPVRGYEFVVDRDEDDWSPENCARPISAFKLAELRQDDCEERGCLDCPHFTSPCEGK
jgi:hypothetical protein